MKTLKKSITVLSLATATLMVSCKQTQTLPLTLKGNNGLKFSGISLKGIKGEVNVKIKNPNPVPVSVFRSSLAIKLNDIPVGKARIKSKLVIPANSEVEEVLYLNSDFSKLGYFDIPKVVKTVQNKNVNVTVKGNLKSGTYFNKISNPVETTNTIDVSGRTRSAWAFVSKVGKKTAKLFSKNTEMN